MWSGGSTSVNDHRVNTYQFYVIWRQHIGERLLVEHLPVLCGLEAAHRRTTTGWTRTGCTSGGRCRRACSLSGPTGSWLCSGLPVRSSRSGLGTWCHIYWGTNSLQCQQNNLLTKTFLLSLLINVIRYDGQVVPYSLELHYSIDNGSIPAPTAYYKPLLFQVSVFSWDHKVEICYQLTDRNTSTSLEVELLTQYDTKSIDLSGISTLVSDSDHHIDAYCKYPHIAG